MRYHETVWSNLFPGSHHTSNALQPAVTAAESALDLSLAQRQRTVWRLDGGGGSDEHLRWLIQRGYHVVAKGLNNRRAVALAKQVKRWDPYRADVWLGEVPPPLDYGRTVRVFVKKRLHKGEYLHSYYVSTLSLPSKKLFLTAYDDRGGAEVEQFRTDKSALSLEARRKYSFTGQLAYILLTDLAHNLLADFQRSLAETPFATYGPKRIVRDLFSIPGYLTVHPDGAIRIQLLTQKQFSADLVPALQKLCSRPKSE